MISAPEIVASDDTSMMAVWCGRSVINCSGPAQGPGGLGGTALCAPGIVIETKQSSAPKLVDCHVSHADARDRWHVR